MKQILVLTFLIFCSLQSASQFFPQQSLYTYNMLSINGAAAGKDNALTATLGSRSMWRGVQGAPVTHYLSMHSPLKEERIALGLQVMSDKIGVSKRTGIFATGAYRIQLNAKGKIAFALTAGMSSVTNGWSQIATTQSDDITFSNGDQSYWMPNIGASIFYHDNQSFAGISIPHFLTETYSGGGVYKADHQMSNYSYHLMAGSKISMTELAYIKPAILLKYHTRSSMQTDATIMGGIQRIGEIGFTYRHRQAMVFVANARVNAQLNVAYSYDYLTGPIGNFARGTHEFALLYTFQYHNNSPDTRFF
ncbi:MAG: PorP/SprF family type IX secretion system membrane protein [Flavobacteriales bacterium]